MRHTNGKTSSVGEERLQWTLVLSLSRLALQRHRQDLYLPSELLDCLPATAWKEIVESFVYSEYPPVLPNHQVSTMTSVSACLWLPRTSQRQCYQRLALRLNQRFFHAQPVLEVEGSDKLMVHRIPLMLWCYEAYQKQHALDPSPQAAPINRKVVVSTAEPVGMQDVAFGTILQVSDDSDDDEDDEAEAAEVIRLPTPAPPSHRDGSPSIFQHKHHFFNDQIVPISIQIDETPPPPLPSASAVHHSLGGKKATTPKKKRQSIFDLSVFLKEEDEVQVRKSKSLLHRSILKEIQQSSAPFSAPLSMEADDSKKFNAPKQVSHPQLKPAVFSNECIIFDCGGDSIKYGLSDSKVPHRLPSVTGKPYDIPALHEALKSRERFVGQKAQDLRGILRCQHPIAHSMTAKWEDLEAFWIYLLHHELHVSPTEHPLIVTDSATSTSIHRQLLAEKVFESFHFPAMYIGIQEAFALYPTGLLNACMCYIGDSVNNTIYIKDGLPLPSSIQISAVAGQELSRLFASRLALHHEEIFGQFQSSVHVQQMVYDLKERYGQVAYDYSREINMTQQEAKDRLYAKYSLPDGHVLELTKERLQCYEPLFQPQLFHLPGQGLHTSIEECVRQANKLQYRPNKKHSSNKTTKSTEIILTGGTAMASGLVPRLHSEFQKRASASDSLGLHHASIRVQSNPREAVYEGCSILSSWSGFHSMCVSKQDYDEYGVNIFFKKGI